MGIEDIQISEELETNAPSIKYRGNEGPKSPQEMEKMMMAQLEEEYLKYVDDMMEQGLEPMTLQQFMQQAMAEGQMAGGQPLPQDPTKPVNPFQPKPTGPTLPDRQMAAYGGIMGLDGRKKYGIGSWFQENIMDPIKENPLVAAAAAAIGGDYILNDRSYIGDFLKGDTMQNILKGKRVAKKDDAGNVISKNGKIVYTDERSGGIYDAIADNIVPIVGGLGAGLFTKNQGGGQDASTFGQVNDQTGIDLAEYKKGINLLDEKGQMAAGQNFAVSDAARKYSPEEMISVYQNAANGGRIGFNMGGGADMGSPQMTAAQAQEEAITKIMQKMQDPNLTDEDRIFLQEKLKVFMPTQQMDPRMMAMGGRIGRAEGGIMDLGGMEKDYRAEGGFVPIGAKERADDVPARLSVNEFVFTADAVRNAGGGDIDQGAQVMENMMKNLEQGGQVSEESQGMGGAQQMFETSQRLSEVI